MTLRTSPLAARHHLLGAKMIDFGGWEMPLAYPSGTLAEHMACRTKAAVFDVSHLGTVRLEDASAFERLQSTLTNDLARIGPGGAQYTHLLDETDGSVVDDVIVWWISERRFDIMPNAANTNRVLEAIGGADVTAERAVISVQGPEARRLLEPVVPEAASVPRFSVTTFEWENAECVAAGTGYTGEDGVECSVPSTPSDLPQRFFDALIDSGGQPAGLGARDTLRLEAGLPLHGHELGPGITPLQAGLGWVVAWGKGHFRGKVALEREREVGPARHLVGLVASGRQPPRQGCPVLRDGLSVGRVTSGNFSPCLGRGIGMALAQARLGVGDEVAVEIRGRLMEAVVAKRPFAGSAAREQARSSGRA